MPNTNASFTPRKRSDDLKEQMTKLESLQHDTAISPTLEAFDLETEEILIRHYGADHRYVETYKYATPGEAEALVNLPESAQEPIAKDRFKMGIQQRRQALLAMLTEMQESEAQEAVALTGEDREDPPSI
ncbi:MAG: hypothetical protein A4E19_18415 [Nitrospira sp. SG-bin1]|nr:MAG: hypothetical protein A4E19_18415 [Nitrospira sp. SG-bin1]